MAPRLQRYVSVRIDWPDAGCHPSAVRFGSRSQVGPSGRRRARSADAMITIALADDESIGREGLRCLLERERDFRVVGHATTGGRDTVRLVVREKPRVLIVRTALPGP